MIPTLNRVPVLAVLLLLSASARAAVIDVTAHGELDWLDDPQGLLPFSYPSAERGFTLTLTFDDTATEDRSVDPLKGVFTQAVQQMQLVVGYQVVDSWAQKAILVLNDQPETMGSSVDIWNAVSAQSTPDAGSGGSRTAAFSLVLLKHSSAPTAPPFESDALVTPPWPYNWSFAIINYQINDYDAQNVFIGTVAEAQANVVSMEIAPSPVPLPPAAWLMGTALAATLARARARRS